jgi:molybdopterin-guanine dinucleotide biosynthesis protein A
MISGEHKKHSDIARAPYGNFAGHEWAILGTHCGIVKNLADEIFRALSPTYKCGYVDAQHADNGMEQGLPGRLGSGAVAEYTSQIHYQQFHFNKLLGPFQFRQLFSDIDFLLINGNHNEAKAQVVVIDNTKMTSLQKRVSQLTHVELLLLADNADKVFDFIKPALPSWQDLPLYKLSDTEKIIGFFESKLRNTKPLLNGLVLAGGNSMRMGRNKATIDWHGKEQQYYMADLLKNYCDEVFISCTEEQKSALDNNYKLISDSFTGLGPYGAILSAFREHPSRAWLVLACDLPLLNAETIRQLIEQRQTSVMATAFESPFDGLPEPLIAIWEPKSYPILLSFLSQGYTCPRKALRNNEIKLVKALDPDALMNVNTPEDSERARKLLLQRNQKV